MTTTSNADGSYKINAAFSTSTNYTLCETPPSGTWAQDVPLPSTTTVCGPNKNGNGASGVPNELLKGLQFTASVGRRHDHRQGLRQRRGRHVQSRRIRSFPNPGPTTSTFRPRDCSTGGSKAHTGFVVDSGVRPERHAVRQRLDRRLQRREGSVARAHQLPQCAEPGRDAQVPHLVYTDPFPSREPRRRCRPARSTRGPAPIPRSSRRHTSTHEPGNAAECSRARRTSCVISSRPPGRGLRRVARRGRLLGRRRAPAARLIRQERDRGAARDDPSRAAPPRPRRPARGGAGPRTPDKQLLVQQTLRPGRLERAIEMFAGLRKPVERNEAGGRGPGRPPRHRRRVIACGDDSRIENLDPVSGAPACPRAWAR